MYSNRNRYNDFEKSFNRLQRVFWILFGVVTFVVIGSWIATGFGVYTLVTDPEAVGTIAAEVIHPIVDVIAGESE